MKPSELIKSYILSKQLPKQQNELSKYFECCFERLDNNFIDREELKEKIKKLLELYKFKYTYELDDDNEETVVAFNFKLEEDILKLLEE